MPRTVPARSLHRIWSLALEANRRRWSTHDVITRHLDRQRRTLSRRHFVRTVTHGVAAGAALSAYRVGAAAPRVAIVGGGLAGLTCADRLQRAGITATVYEAASRLGGRCFSNRTLVPGMACENGGELIDTGHKTVLGYANEFGLALESYIKKRGEESYYFFGRHWSEAEVVNEFRQVVDRMQRDLRAISGSATFYRHTAHDVAFDHLDLATYFASRTNGLPLVAAVLNEAYLAEFGLETWQQSTLNFLGFMRLNRQSKFEPFGVSDERYHLIDGNDGLVAGLQSKLRGPLLTGARLTKLARTAGGRYQLYFNGSTRPDTADAVVLAVPFSVLRRVDLDASLGLSADKARAIASLGYGMNAKTMIAFRGRPWATLHGSGGGAYSDLANLQTCWESNRGRARQFGIITDYASGARGAALRVNALDRQVGQFLTDFDTVLPGMQAAAARAGGRYVAHLEHWPSNPNALGSYTCYTPGQFTTVAGLEAEPAGLVKFAGEHTDSFYSWQGFMEGACLSGIRAANELLADVKAGVLV